MKNNLKRMPLILLAVVMGISACQPTLVNPDAAALEESLRNPKVVIPSTDKGAISGSVTFDNTSNDAPPETTVKIIRDQDIFEKDKNGKVVQDPKTKKDKILERKGQTLDSIKLSSTGTFLVTNLRPGTVIVSISSAKQPPSELASTIEAGKVTKLRNVAFNQPNSGAPQVHPTLSISGKVVRADGTPIASARVSDVTGGFINNFTTTNSEGEFNLPTSQFTTSRNLEISSDNLTTSLAVTPEQIENLTIPLIANSRSVKGAVFDSVLRNKVIPNITVRVVGTTISTVTDTNGTFTMRGVPLTSTTLEFSSADGSYVTFTQNVASSNDSTETDLKSLYIRPIGNLSVTLLAESSPVLTTALFVNGVCPRGYSAIRVNSTTSNCYYDNEFHYLDDIQGSLQLEGTNITKSFTYPKTPIYTVKEFITATETADRILFLSNLEFSVPLNNIPGGEYNLTVVLPFHQTQKGLKVVIPSNDTIATERVLMRHVLQVISVGDIRGKVLIKDRAGKQASLSGAIKVAAIDASLNLAGNVTLTSGDTKKVINAIFENRDDTNVKDLISSYDDAVQADGTYTLKNAPTGTKIIVAGVVDGGVLSDAYLPATYSLLNVVSGSINAAPDLDIIKRD